MLLSVLAKGILNELFLLGSLKLCSWQSIRSPHSVAGNHFYYIQSSQALEELRQFEWVQNKTAQRGTGRLCFWSYFGWELPLLTHEMHQHYEQIDKVQVQPESTHNCFFLSNYCPVSFVVLLFDALGVVGGETRKY